MKDGEAITNQVQPNPQADAWRSVENVQLPEPEPKGKYVEGPDGKMIPEDQYDAAMEAYEREQFYQAHPEARETDAYYARLEEMANNPDRLDNFEGEHVRGGSTRDSEYTTLNSGENGMYAAAPDGGPLNNAARKEMSRMMHDAEDLQRFEADGQYTDYIERERAKIGTVYKSRDEFNHRVASRLNRLAKKHEEADAKAKEEAAAKAREEAEAKAREEAEAKELEGDIDGKLTDDEIDEINDILGESEGDIDGKLTDDEIDEINDILDGSADDYDEQLDQRARELKGEKDLDPAFLEGLEKDCKNAHAELEEIRAALAESYAKNRGLFNRKNGPARAEFNKLRESFSAKLNEFLRAKAKYEREKGEAQNGKDLEAEKERISKELKEGKLTIEEANQALGDKWVELCNDLKGKISADFTKNYLDEQKKLEAKTIDRIDNGNIYRKFVSKVLNNKVLKGVLAAAGIAGLAATGIGLATGTLALSVGYTAGGIAIGAGRGAGMGLLMSRQSSKNSVVNDFANQNEIMAKLKEIDASNEANSEGVKNVTDWLMQEYNKANRADLSSNRKRTLIATGLGAALGAAMSGVHVDQNVEEIREGTRFKGYEPSERQAANLEDVNHAKGYGTQQLFRELGGNGDTYYSSGAHDRMASIIQKYGMTVGENDWTYPGPISEWPSVAREAFTEVANDWAKNNLVPSIKVGGAPIYDTVTYSVNTAIASKLYSGVLDAATAVGAGILGGGIAGRRNTVRPEES